MLLQSRKTGERPFNLNGSPFAPPYMTGFGGAEGFTLILGRLGMKRVFRFLGYSFCLNPDTAGEYRKAIRDFRMALCYIMLR